ncbi:hypothetical protein HGG82_07935 [Marinomonas sp. M1K-6]|uniref:Peptidoglycan domain protein n=1 Tax=Marinomonas profundi TaxID=2726122 RepID=A0A847R8Q4_9GAMM|nr:glycosyl hydrolase 108 family protein [Marinomonas profundi]NLQ17557.1 hypothetical protein [Marinomonas profundi]UDV02226.1 hypothetical protein J8N69_11545 [Marinomonas profundi]
MSHFKTALADVLKHEGGYVDHKNDNGGATAFGISLRFLSILPALAGDVNGDGHVNKDDVKALSKEDAAKFYETYFWLHYRLNEVETESIAVKLMNLFVNMRGKTAALIAQRAANDLGAGLVEDGILGSKSMAVLNSLEAEPLLVCIKYQAWAVYKAIVENTPSQAVFINGWQKRAFA